MDEEKEEYTEETTEEVEDEPTEETTEEEVGETTEEEEAPIEEPIEEVSEQINEQSAQLELLQRENEELKKKLEDALVAYAKIADALGVVDVEAPAIQHDDDYEYGENDAIALEDISKFIS